MSWLDTFKHARLLHPEVMSVLWSLDYRLENLAKDVKIAGLDAWKAQTATQETLHTLGAALGRVVVALERANFLKEVELTGATHLLQRTQGDESGLIARSDEELAKIEAALDAYKRANGPPIPPNEPDMGDVGDWSGA